jgi:outer membrane protein TolC
MRTSSAVVPLVVALLALPAAAQAPRRVDLPTLLAHARRAPTVRAARAAAEAVRAREPMWLPTIDLTAAAGPGPEVTCEPSAEDCRRTTPSELRPSFAGVFWRVDARLTLPVLTFGKLGAAERAAAAGSEAAGAQADAAEADAVLAAARAYYAVASWCSCSRRAATPSTRSWRAWARRSTPAPAT